MPILKINAASVFLSLLCCLGAAVASAEQSVTLGVFGGTITANGGNYTSYSPHRGVLSEIKNGPLFGLQFGLDVGPYFGIETTLGASAGGYLVRVMDSTGGGSGEPFSVSDETTDPLGYIHENAVINLLKGRVVPYVTGGIGWIVLIDDKSFAFNYGGGVKGYLTDRFGVKLTIRRFSTNLKSSIAEFATAGWDPRDWGWVGYEFKDKLRFTELSAQLLYHFGAVDRHRRR